MLLTFPLNLHDPPLCSLPKDGQATHHLTGNQMLLRPFIPAVLFLVLAAPAWGSFDVYCSPTWTLAPSNYDRCTQLPILSPSNDRRVNLKLLLVDGGFARLKEQPPTGEDAELGYGSVPFRLDTFENLIFPGRGQASATAEASNTNFWDVSRCTSNEAGKARFIEAVGAHPEIPDGERQLLLAERQRLNPTCANNPEEKTTATGEGAENAQNIVTEVGKGFLLYIRGAAAFYEGRYEEALSVFNGLADSREPWLKETSRYMLGRTELNNAQKQAFDEYGFPDLKNVDETALERAETQLAAYLESYPEGRYASSARGLLRRIYWLSNRPREFAAECEWQITHPDSPQHNMSLDDFALEIDGKLLDMPGAEDLETPRLLAVRDLALMRSASPSEPARISLGELQKQEAAFAGNQPLYRFLVAAHYLHVQKNPTKALEHLPGTIPAQTTYLDFSRLVLRGLALEAVHDHAAARKLWLELLPASKEPLQAEAVQLALALNFQQSRGVDAAFKVGSPVTEGAIRRVLIAEKASAPLLRQIAQDPATSARERDFALYTLLYKDLLQGHYADFGADYKLISDDKRAAVPVSGNFPPEPSLTVFNWSGKKSGDSYGCPSALETAQKLAHDPDDPYGLLCLGDFVKSEFPGLNSKFAEIFDSQPVSSNSAVLGAGPSDFPGEEFSRGEAYKAVAADEDASPDERAYALYRLVRCYAPAGVNDCGGEDVNESVRKSWFTSLKSKYPGSFWARRLKYYW